MSRTPLRIRQAESADVDGICALLAESARTAGAAVRVVEPHVASQLPKRVSALLEREDCVVLVAVEQACEHPLGVLVMSGDQVAAVSPVPVLNVSHLVVDETQRRRGVGRALLVAAVHEADMRGVDHLVATAVTGSREANRYLARLGFAPLVTRRIASTQVLRRSLGLADAQPQRVARMRRLRGKTNVRAANSGIPTVPTVTVRAVSRGA